MTDIGFQFNYAVSDIFDVGSYFTEQALNVLTIVLKLANLNMQDVRQTAVVLRRRSHAGIR
jgi:hypothetical protein